MHHSKQNARYVPVLVFILGILVLLPGVWLETSITGKDEYWLSLRTPMEMLERDTWLTPYVNGEPRLKKPPLLYWGILINYKVFGIGLPGARIWGVLAGAGLALCAALLSRRLFGRSGLLAALITLSTIAVTVEGRRAMLDLPMATLVSFAVYFAVRWGETGRRAWILASSLSLGLSTLVKGPIGLIFFAAAAFSALWVFEKWRFAAAHWPQLLAATGLFFLICLPWPLAMAHMWPEFPETVGREMGSERFGRILLSSPFRAIGGALGLIFPWSIVTMAAITGVFRKKRTRHGQKGPLAGLMGLHGRRAVLFLPVFCTVHGPACSVRLRIERRMADNGADALEEANRPPHRRAFRLCRRGGCLFRHLVRDKPCFRLAVSFNGRRHDPGRMQGKTDRDDGRSCSRIIYLPYGRFVPIIRNWAYADRSR